MDNRKQVEIMKRIKDSGLSKEGVAKKLGVSGAYLSQILNGKANLPEDIRNKINKITAQAIQITA